MSHVDPTSPFADTAGVGRAPKLRIMLPLALLIAVGEAWTFLAFNYACNADTLRSPFTGLCSGGQGAHSQILLPVLGCLAVLAGIARSRAQHTYRGFVIGAGVGVIAGLALWLLYGDPSDHFGGLLSYVKGKA